ncbi:MAG: hypothetical protein GY861_24295 [bacterium]|nr:hypothetical protein [bacterium]
MTNEQTSPLQKKIVAVQFNTSTKEYTYLTDLDLKKDDLVIVKSPTDEYIVVTVCKVRGLTQNQLSLACKWIVQKVDLVAYEANMKKQELVQEIRNKLQERRKETEEIMIYQQLSASDPEIKSLLGELAGIDPTLVPQLPAPKADEKK